MGLSSELISQFVKITNDSKEKPKESTVYGTVKSSNDKLFVQLDGASLLTPVISTANVKDGDRVTVMIKNHSAIVTGNVSSPSASNESLLQLSEDLGLLGGDLEGITNDFDLLVKSVTEINNDLTTAENNITGLAGRVGTVEGRDIFYGSSILWPAIIDISDNNRHNLLTSGAGDMINELFKNTSAPSGYRKCFRLSAALSTNNGGAIDVGFNGKMAVTGGTWSKNTYAKAHVSGKFRDWTEFPTEKADGYEYDGLNLYYQLKSPSTTGRIYGITLLGYFEKI